MNSLKGNSTGSARLREWNIRQVLGQPGPPERTCLTHKTKATFVETVVSLCRGHLTSWEVRAGSEVKGLWCTTWVQSPDLKSWVQWLWSIFPAQAQSRREGGRDRRMKVCLTAQWQKYQEWPDLKNRTRRGEKGRLTNCPPISAWTVL